MKKERIFIKTKLAEHELTQVWLIQKLEERGIITDKTETCSVLKGTRRGKKAETIICNAVEILKKYKNNL